MRQFLITACLLILAPASVVACYEEHKAGERWFDDRPWAWSDDGLVAQGMHRDKLMDVSMFAGGSGVLILLGVGMRTRSRAARPGVLESLEPASRVPLAMPIDGPPCEPLCVLGGVDPHSRLGMECDAACLAGFELTLQTIEGTACFPS